MCFWECPPFKNRRGKGEYVKGNGARGLFKWKMKSERVICANSGKMTERVCEE
jgi:hypothetical protein